MENIIFLKRIVKWIVMLINRIYEKPSEPQIDTYWCVLCSDGVICPYYCEQGVDEAVTAINIRYRRMIIYFFGLN